MNIYATEADLTAGKWLTAPLPANLDALLRSATVLVAVASGRNAYNSAPIGAEAEALRDATCAQVTAWVVAGLDPAGGVAGDTAPLKRTEIFEGKVEYDTASVAAARAQAIRDLCSEALGILRMTGLLLEALPLFNDTGWLPTWGLDSPAAYRWPSLSEWPQL